MKIGQRYLWKSRDMFVYVVEITSNVIDHRVDINVLQIIKCTGIGKGLGPRNHWDTSIDEWILLAGQEASK
jgi:hypothetical protein